MIVKASSLPVATIRKGRKKKKNLYWDTKLIIGKIMGTESSSPRMNLGHFQLLSCCEKKRGDAISRKVIFFSYKGEWNDEK